MVTKILRKNFSKKDINSVKQFALRNPIYPFHSDKLIDLMINELVSSDNYLFDYFIGAERIGFSVMIDRISNKGNTANIELIGFNKECNFQEYLEMLMSDVDCPLVKSGVQISSHNDYDLNPTFLKDRGYRFYYSSFELKALNPIIDKMSLCTEYSFVEVNHENFDEYYNILNKVFESNLDLNIPEKREYREYLKKQTISPQLLLVKDTVVGFFTIKIGVAKPRYGEINTIGVLPQYRKKGFGKVLLGQALHLLGKNNVEYYKLFVATNNIDALKLYEDYNFDIVDTTNVFVKWK